LQQIKIVKTLFHIGSEKYQEDNAVLLLEIGTDHINYSWYQEGSNALVELKYCSIDEFEIKSALQSILEETKRGGPARVFICSAFPGSFLTPLKYASTADTLLQLTFDMPAQAFFRDNINDWQLVNSYSLAEDVYAIINESYPEARYLHEYTPALKNSSVPGGEDRIFIHFTTQFFRILVKKGAHIELVQTYAYKTPLDVVYYLLKIVSEIGIDQSEVSIYLSGLIEEASALFTEIRNYFLHISFYTNTSVALPENDLPRHFFASTSNLAVCV
jgi:hypothetical protein